MTVGASMVASGAWPSGFCSDFFLILMNAAQDAIMQMIEWVQPDWIEEIGHVVVWVDVVKADASWALDLECYLPRGEACRLGKYIRFEHWLRGRQEAVLMPETGLDEGQFCFSNGRHRFAWMRDHGARAIPICAHHEDEAELRSLFGAESQVCRVEMPTPKQLNASGLMRR